MGQKDDNKLPIVVVCLLLPMFGVELKSKRASRKGRRKRGQTMELHKIMRPLWHGICHGAWHLVVVGGGGGGGDEADSFTSEI